MPTSLIQQVVRRRALHALAVLEPTQEEERCVALQDNTLHTALVAVPTAQRVSIAMPETLIVHYVTLLLVTFKSQPIQIVVRVAMIIMPPSLNATSITETKKIG